MEKRSLETGLKESEWYSFTGKIRERWPLLEEESLEILKSAPDMLIGRLQEHYGMTRAEAEKEYTGFIQVNHFAHP